MIFHQTNLLGPGRACGRKTFVTFNISELGRVQSMCFACVFRSTSSIHGTLVEWRSSYDVSSAQDGLKASLDNIELREEMDLIQLQMFLATKNGDQVGVFGSAILSKALLGQYFRHQVKVYKVSIHFISFVYHSYPVSE